MGMPTYLAGYDIGVTFDLSTIGFAPSSAVYTVVDEEGNTLIGPMVATIATPAGGQPSVNLIVPAVYNQLPGNIPAAWNTVVTPTAIARTVYLQVVGPEGAGATPLEQGYRLVAQDRLLAPQNTFMTLQMAQVMAMDIPNVPNWNAATPDQQIAALMEARNRIGRLTFRYQPDDWQMRVSPWLSVHDFDEMNTQQWQTTDYLFKTALRRAQVLEADEALGEADFYTNKMQGVVEVKIGDSQRVYSRMRKPRFPLGDRAMKVLSKYIDNKRVGRA